MLQTHEHAVGQCLCWTCPQLCLLFRGGVGKKSSKQSFMKGTPGFRCFRRQCRKAESTKSQGPMSDSEQGYRENKEADWPIQNQ